MSVDLTEKKGFFKKVSGVLMELDCTGNFQTLNNSLIFFSCNPIISNEALIRPLINAGLLRKNIEINESRVIEIPVCGHLNGSKYLCSLTFIRRPEGITAVSLSSAHLS